MTSPARHAGMLAAALLLQGGPPSRVAPHTAEIDHEFTRIVGVRELGADRILVADAGERALLAADWRTGAARVVGRAGRGPGEYTSVSSIYALAADSSLLVDGSGSRWLLLKGDSIVVTLPPETPAMRAGSRTPWGADSLGNVISFRPVPGIAGFQASGSALRVDSTMFLRIRRRDGHADTLPTLAARPVRVSVRGTTDADRTVSVMFNPLSAGDVAVMFPDGWTAVGRTDPYRVDWIPPSGAVRRGAPLPFERIAVTEKEKRALLAAEAARRGVAPRDPAAVDDWPEFLPPFLVSALVPAGTGHVWIRRVPTADHPETDYDVVDRTGARVARFTMGADERVVAIGALALYTVFTDDDGIEHLRKHPLPRY